MAGFADIRWLFFDLGSTLIDERLAYEHRFRDIAELSGVSYEKVWDTALEFYRDNRKGDLETAKAYHVPLPPWHEEDERLYTDTPECLETLHGSYRIGVIANQSPGTEERLRRHGILHHIDMVVASAEEGIAKPDPGIFEIALARSGCAPCQAVMIGDRIDNDIIPAKRLGMHTVWVKQGFGGHWSVRRELERADAVVGSLAELCGILQI